MDTEDTEEKPKDTNVSRLPKWGSRMATSCSALQSTMATSCRALDLGLYITLVLQALLPTIYQTVRVSLLGNLPSDQGVNIASQVVWLSLFFEVIQEALVLPLYNCIGCTVLEDKVTRNKVKTGLVLITGLFGLLCSALYPSAPILVRLMAVHEEGMEDTVNYIRIEIIALLLQSINNFLLIPMELLKLKGALLTTLFVRLVLTIILDLTFLSQASFSLQLGVQGLAWSNILTNLAVLLLSLVFLSTRLGLGLGLRCQFGWVTDWAKLAFFSGLDSLMRNLTYLLVVLRSFNQLDQAGLYWTSNTLIWSWLLLPALPLSELLRIKVASSSPDQPKQPHLTRLAVYFGGTLLIALVWAASIPGWEWMFETVLNAESPSENKKITLILCPFYILFMFSNLFNSIFVALGRIKLIALKSLFGNIFISILFSLTMFDVIPLTIISVSLIFGCGLVFGFIASFVIYMYVMKKEHFLL